MRLLLLLPLVFLASCAHYEEPVPEGYQGPTAMLADTCIRESGSKAGCYVVIEINGKPVDNAIDESRRASSGRGSALTIATAVHRVPITPLTIKIRATHVTAAPIEEIIDRAAGHFYSVEGVVKLQPEAGAVYGVRGILESAGSSVWIEETVTGRVVTEKIASGRSAK
jgi:hypothetical protein